MAKEIRVRCETSKTLPWKDLVDFQGTLKILSQTNFEKLKNSILKLGFSFPVFVWKYRNKYHVIDGHQRLKVLEALENEGYSVPETVPVVEVEARTKKEAKQKLLAVLSQFGEVTVPGLEDFLSDLEVDLSSLQEMVSLPDIDLVDFGEVATATEAPPVITSSLLIEYLPNEREAVERFIGREIPDDGRLNFSEINS